MIDRVVERIWTLLAVAGTSQISHCREWNGPLGPAAIWFYHCIRVKAMPPTGFPQPVTETAGVLKQLIPGDSRVL